MSKILSAMSTNSKGRLSEGNQLGVLAQGAEAIITLENNNIIKNRIPKLYRIKEIDEKLRKQRTKSEAKLLEKASKIINCPRVLKQDKFSIEIEYIQGDKLSQTLNSYEEKKQFEVMQILGEEVGKLHNEDIIHGDLTTSNTILVENSSKDNINKAEKDLISSLNKSNSLLINSKEPLGDYKIIAKQLTSYQVYIIDFGLGFISKRIEDKAVDLHLIKQALEAKHFQNHQELFNHFLKGYNPKDKKLILEQLKEVESRGRYKH